MMGSATALWGGGEVYPTLLLLNFEAVLESSTPPPRAGRHVGAIEFMFYTYL